MTQQQTDYLAEARRLWAGGDPNAAIDHAIEEYDRLGPTNPDAARVLDEFIREGMLKTGRGRPLPGTPDGKLDWDAMTQEEMNDYAFVEGIDDTDAHAL